MIKDTKYMYWNSGYKIGLLDVASTEKTPGSIIVYERDEFNGFS
jgi:hypothetical protein